MIQHDVANKLSRQNRPPKLAASVKEAKRQIELTAIETSLGKLRRVRKSLAEMMPILKQWRQHDKSSAAPLDEAIWRLREMQKLTMQAIASLIRRKRNALKEARADECGP